MGTKHIRLKRYDPRHGIVTRQYWYQGIKFLESEGWYVVDDKVATYLKANARQRANDLQSTEAFDICTKEQAQQIDELEAMAAEPRRPAEKARAASARDATPRADKQSTKRSKKLSEKMPTPEPFAWKASKPETDAPKVEKESK